MSCSANGSKIDDRQCTVRVRPVQQYASLRAAWFTSAWRPRLVTRLAPRLLPAAPVGYGSLRSPWVTGCAGWLPRPGGLGWLRGWRRVGYLGLAASVGYAAGAAWVTSAWRPRLVTRLAPRGLPRPGGLGWLRGWRRVCYRLRRLVTAHCVRRGLPAAPVGYGSLRSPWVTSAWRPRLVTRLAPRWLRAAPVGYGSLCSPWVTGCAGWLPRPGGLG
jgi:hypothetical protein